MEPPEMVPAEETVEALIEGLVSPFLPRRGISWDNPSTEQQEAVAKQMYAVNLLYNYYHRKLFPKLEFLDFNSFCKIACISKPSLLKYMNAMCKSDMSSGDLDEPLSITERMIMDACNVSSALDASKDFPDMKGWPISKVAVFLVDPSKEHCLLRSSSSTVTVKLLIEKNLEMPLENVVGVPEMGNALGSNTNASGLLKDKFNGLEDRLQEVAFSTVKEEMGIDNSNLSILGSYLSYSLSRMKSCARLYIMSYAEPIVNQIPIKGLMQSLQGPLVKINSAPEVTEVVGKTSHSALQHIPRQKTDLVNKGSEGVLVIDIHEVSDDSGWSQGNMNNCSKASTNTEIIGSFKNYPSLGESSVRSQNAAFTFVTEKPVLSTVKEEATVDDFPALTKQNWDTLMSKKRKLNNSLAGSSGTAHQYNADDSFNENLKKLDGDWETNLENAISHNSVKEAKNDLNQAGGTMNNMIVALNSDNHDALALSKKVDRMSVLQMLKKKREELCHQQRLLEDNIAHCEMSIQTVLSGKDSSESKVEFMLKTCELICPNEMKNDANFSTEAQCQSQTVGRKKLCEAVLRLQSPCQELDEIFCTNNWILPKYCVLPSSDGKFQALVTVRGMDFECESHSDWKTSPKKARESAATNMLNKLRSMAAQAN
ncbi:uncharacterized protein LOC110113969 isoform X2 [Dendrobium catenatum]|uniref:uncharacterized protein LOC110113969 isoform X2 n=1 Tax=Dendrobium catenatum TaxID=906689 RepID=UPI00109F847B|nr:uncharacterized protein LOC110113969 isoform X2 [Dendrobium catenatum]